MLAVRFMFFLHYFARALHRADCVIRLIPHANYFIMREINFPPWYTRHWIHLELSVADYDVIDHRSWIVD